MVKQATATFKTGHQPSTQKPPRNPQKPEIPMFLDSGLAPSARPGTLPDDAKDAAIVRSLIAMAHHLGLKVIAKGVETLAQAAFLRAERCDEVQGFLYAKTTSSCGV